MAAMFGTYTKLGRRNYVSSLPESLHASDSHDCTYSNENENKGEDYKVYRRDKARNGTQ